MKSNTGKSERHCALQRHGIQKVRVQRSGIGRLPNVHLMLAFHLVVKMGIFPRGWDRLRRQEIEIQEGNRGMATIAVAKRGAELESCRRSGRMRCIHDHGGVRMIVATSGVAIAARQQRKQQYDHGHHGCKRSHVTNVSWAHQTCNVYQGIVTYVTKCRWQ